MPISRTATEAFTLRAFDVDVIAGRAIATFIHEIDGANVGEKQIVVEGAPLLAILGAAPDATKTRANDITDAWREINVLVQLGGGN